MKVWYQIQKKLNLHFHEIKSMKTIIKKYYVIYSMKSNRETEMRTEIEFLLTIRQENP